MRRHYQLFGALQIKVDGEFITPSAGRQSQLLLRLLVAGGPVTDAELRRSLAQFEGRAKGASDKQNLYTLVSRLRTDRLRDPDKQVLVNDHGTYQLIFDRADVDVYQFRELIKQARAVREEEPGRARELLEHARGMWKSLAHLDAYPAAKALIEVLHSEYREVSRDLLNLLLHSGDPGTAEKPGGRVGDQVPRGQALSGYPAEVPGATQAGGRRVRVKAHVGEGPGRYR